MAKAKAEETSQITPPPEVLGAFKRRFNRSDLSIVRVTTIPTPFGDEEVLSPARWGWMRREQRPVAIGDFEGETPPLQKCEVTTVFLEQHPSIWYELSWPLDTSREDGEIEPGLIWGCLDHPDIDGTSGFGFYRRAREKWEAHICEAHSTPKSP